jgi:hypothetical protein
MKYIDVEMLTDLQGFHHPFIKKTGVLDEDFFQSMHLCKYASRYHFNS